MDIFPFKLKAPMLVLEEIVKPADISALSRTGCSICSLHWELKGNECALGPDGGPSEISFLSGGFSIGLAPLGSALPPSPLPSVNKVPGCLAPGGTRFGAGRISA
eukprot:2452778-Pyramimonas_sp.AAC.1